MKTFDRYLFSEVLANFSATVLVLLVVIVGRLLSKLLEKAAAGDYPLDVIRSLLLYGAADSLIFLLPFSAMLAVMLAMGRHYRDGEAYAAFSFGVGYARICRVLMLWAVPLTALLFVLVMEVSPAGERQYQAVKQAGKQRGDVTMVTAGRFFSPRENTVLFVEDYDRDAGRLFNVFIADVAGDRTLIETAGRGEQKTDADGVKRLHLYDGRRYEGVPGRDEYRVSSYREHAVFLPTRVVRRVGDDPEAKTFSELWRSGKLEDRAEWQWRLATVVSLPVLVLLAFPLSRSAPRRGRNARIAAAVLVFLIYENLVILVVDLVGAGRFPVFPGVWWIPVAALASAFIMLTRRRKGGTARPAEDAP